MSLGSQLRVKRAVIWRQRGEPDHLVTSDLRPDSHLAARSSTWGQLVTALGREGTVTSLHPLGYRSVPEARKVRCMNFDLHRTASPAFHRGHVHFTFIYCQVNFSLRFLPMSLKPILSVNKKILYSYSLLIVSTFNK